MIHPPKDPASASCDDPGTPAPDTASSQGAELCLDEPVRSLLEAAALTPTEIAPRVPPRTKGQPMGVKRTAVTASRAAGPNVELSTLRRFAEAAGGKLRITFIRRKDAMSTNGDAPLEPAQLIPGVGREGLAQAPARAEFKPTYEFIVKERAGLDPEAWEAAR